MTVYDIDVMPLLGRNSERRELECRRGAAAGNFSRV